jgi:predicted amidophosphoribosyltransferase
VAYDADVRRLVAAWKERGLRGLAEDAAELAAVRLPASEADVVTFVPPDSERRLERGYHPAAGFARALARRWELPCDAILRRTRPSRPQRGLSLAERRRNVRAAFASDAASGRVLLVDDVYTSGSTVSAAASALRASGASRVDVLTFARAIRSPG